ncbi:hypothetical protein JCM19298_2869 [Nonlabens ulvanivorans]|nr:hypothetical protein [Nonlabens ulvanivorans]GAK92381.1 hypothetical protein JCM19298_2869 [Nonlabens ulvanivorans]
MNNILSLSLTVLVQQATPPVPKMGPGIPPPVGDVPLDDNLWVLLVSALLIGAMVVYKNRQKAL